MGPSAVMHVLVTCTMRSSHLPGAFADCYGTRDRACQGSLSGDEMYSSADEFGPDAAVQVERHCTGVAAAPVGDTAWPAW